MARTAAPCTSTCPSCEKQPAPWVPKVDDVPEPLRNLSRDVAMALRPLDVDCGPYRRGDHGYRVHTALIRFSWSTQSVTSKIAELPSASMRKQARKAHKFLVGTDTSEYRTFAEKHDKFLLAHPQATPEEAKLPLQFIETPGIECALWPDLYFHSDLCETVERATDVRRLARQASLQAALDAEESDREEEEEDGPPQGRHSVRRSFLRKILGPITDYAAEYELLHFVFDLCMWSDIGGKKHALGHMPLRLGLERPTLDAGFLGHEARGAAGPSTSVRPARPVQDLGAVRVGSALPPLAAARYVHGEEVASSPGRSRNAPPLPHHDGDVPRMGARRRGEARACFFALEQPFLKSPGWGRHLAGPQLRRPHRVPRWQAKTGDSGLSWPGDGAPTWSDLCTLPVQSAVGASPACNRAGGAEPSSARLRARRPGRTHRQRLACVRGRLGLHARGLLAPAPHRGRLGHGHPRLRLRGDGRHEVPPG